jgi:RloB-like protein
MASKKKAWENRIDTSRRRSPYRDVKNTFLIYCEGVNTEPEYFKSFPVTTETEVIAIGLGRSHRSLVEKIIDILDKSAYLKGQKDYDQDRQIWCVFDKDIKGDTHEDHDFNSAIELAKQNSIHVAYSNDAFELWFVLHDRYMEGALHRTQYYEILSQKLGYNYVRYGKEKDYARKLYAFFLKEQSNALKFAEKLHQNQLHLTPSQQNPCTLVYQLVLALNKCLRE